MQKFIMLLISTISLVNAEDNKLKIWEKYIHIQSFNNNDKYNKYIEKYGFRELQPGESFYETYTSKAVCAHDDESPKNILSMVYYGGAPVNSVGTTSFYCHHIKFNEQKYYLWICSSEMKEKLIIAITEPTKRPFNLDEFEKVSGNAIMDSMEPLTDIKPDTKYMGDKIIGQIIVDSELPHIKSIDAKVLADGKIASIEISLVRDMTYKFTFDPEKKSLIKVEDKKE